jgi:hypothetical protein
MVITYTYSNSVSFKYIVYQDILKLPFRGSWLIMTKDHKCHRK